jgi:hypothetical protein
VGGWKVGGKKKFKYDQKLEGMAVVTLNIGMNSIILENNKTENL